MPRAKQKMHSYLVRVRSTIIEDYEIEAVDEVAAKQMVQIGEGTFCNEVERPDWEVESVRLND